MTGPSSDPAAGPAADPAAGADPPAEQSDVPAEDVPERPGLGDLVGGALAAVLGVAIVLYARGFPALPGGAPGPALFPSIIGGLLAFFGLVLVVRWFRHGRRGEAEGEAASVGEADSGVGAESEAAGEPEAEPVRRIPARTALVNAGAVLGSVVLYLLLADLLGFAITMAVLLFGLMWRLGARPVVAAASAVATTALIYVLFVMVLLVPLPTGPFG